MKPNFKYAVIHRHREKYPLSRMCQFFEVSRSGYYKYVNQLEHPVKDSDKAGILQKDIRLSPDEALA